MNAILYLIGKNIVHMKHKIDLFVLKYKMTFRSIRIKNDILLFEFFKYNYIKNIPNPFVNDIYK